MAWPLDNVRRLFATALDLMLARAEFATLELARSRAQLLRWLVLALLALIFALLTVLAGSALLVALLWPVLGWKALMVLFGLYLVGAIVPAWRLRRELADAAPPMSETLAELRRDRDALFGAQRDVAAPNESS
jgi:uncharacterized membrane protein YqjE